MSRRILFALLALSGVAAAAVMLVAISGDRPAAGAAALEPPPPAPPSAPPAAPARPAAPLDARTRTRLRATAEDRRLAELLGLEGAIAWRSSRAAGRPDAGRLVNGVRLPEEGVHFFTWDPVRWRAPNRPARRHGTDRLVRMIVAVAAGYAAANPDAPRVAVGDLSRPGGGGFDARFGVLREFGRGAGGLGHVSHQNGLDVDVYYPRRDGRERAPDSLADVELELAQDLVDRFVAAGARFVFVGPHTGLTGPPGIVQPLARHDDHLHVRLP